MMQMIRLLYCYLPLIDLLSLHRIVITPIIIIESRDETYVEADDQHDIIELSYRLKSIVSRVFKKTRYEGMKIVDDNFEFISSPSDNIEDRYSTITSEDNDNKSIVIIIPDKIIRLKRVKINHYSGTLTLHDDVYSNVVLHLEMFDHALSNKIAAQYLNI